MLCTVMFSRVKAHQCADQPVSFQKHIPVGSQCDGSVVMLGEGRDVLVLDLDDSRVVQGMGEDDGRYSWTHTHIKENELCQSVSCIA